MQEGRFIRTTDEDHINATKEFWMRCEKAGDIYRANYKLKYCSGCELEKTDSELEGGKCTIHPNLEVEEREEENYFFKFSNYKNKLLDLYEKYPDFVIPNSRLNEIKNFISSELKDFSISRLKDKMPWGIPVPGDESHVMYVWFDALVNYISTLGWPNDSKKFEEYWGTKESPQALQFAGKDNLRQQSAMWQAMLLSAGLPTSRQIVIHGFITADGQKISKSLGNVVDPFELTEKYGTDALRYYLLREFSPFEDGDFSEEKFKNRYNGDLANGLGNFSSRTLTLGAQIGEISKDTASAEKEIDEKIKEIRKSVELSLSEFKFNEALAHIWELLSFGDVYANNHAPWAEKDLDKKSHVISQLIIILDNVSGMLSPFLPDTSEKIKKCITWDDSKLSVEKCSILFPRIQ